MTNEWIDDAGNAALALNLAGQKSTLVWWLPTPSYTGRQSLTSLLPDGVWPLLAVARGHRPRRWPAGGAAGWGRSSSSRSRSPSGPRRPPRDEPGSTSATAPATERPNTSGHRRPTSSARGSGLPTNGDDRTPWSRLSRRARGAGPTRSHAVLYGPPPEGDQALVTLGHQLAALEQEVRRA